MLHRAASEPKHVARSAAVGRVGGHVEVVPTRTCAQFMQDRARIG